MNNTNDTKTFDEIVEEQDSGSDLSVDDTVRLVLSSNCAKAAAYLDMRLLLRSTVMDRKEWKCWKEMLNKYYVEFFCMMQIVGKEGTEGKEGQNGGY